MTEQTPPPGPHEPDEPTESWTPLPDETSTADDEPTHTGVPGVDAVLAEIDDLDELPLDEHLGAFERAHDALRSALDAAPDTAPETAPDTGPGDPAADEPA
jgi:hypothetical protein